MNDLRTLLNMIHDILVNTLGAEAVAELSDEQYDAMIPDAIRILFNEGDFLKPTLGEIIIELSNDFCEGHLLEMDDEEIIHAIETIGYDLFERKCEQLLLEGMA